MWILEERVHLESSNHVYFYTALRSRSNQFVCLNPENPGGIKALFTHQCRFGTVNFLPDQDSKVRPRQEASQNVANFIM